ncbi:patatin-like phospholipase domain-containing protein 2 isoform X2 [Gouania willdenowi]|uniref:patatin-like phospholipase domain-containing protein 2 isoform X2 n=1 Tax=Gouania willdenowi TaxID=441366 RepID=UPI00105500EF|nr:patatin-like phospholipase domain-containing protein 2 isoform X2 [Gouania willdenowi]
MLITGATSCILQRFPRFIQEASNIYGASSGALMAAILVLQIPIDKCCADLMSMAKEARKHKLGPLHPAFNLLQMVKDTLQRHLPHDAHLRASGKLCVSLTRVPDGKNVLVSEFNSRDELIQALICSCFIPFYCGVIPPTYRGVRYIDGAASNNLPRCHQRNTITFSPYAGESDVCPRLSTLSFHRVVFNNVSIQVNPENVYRVTSTFFPPEPEAMAEICQKGYMDALRFLQENNLLSSESPLRGLQTGTSQPTCCETVRKNTAEHHGVKTIQCDHRWLDVQLIEQLPVDVQRVLCAACRETYSAAGLFSQMAAFLPKKVASYLQFPRNLPVDSSYLLAQRLVNWIPDVPKDLGWITGFLGGKTKQAMVEDRVKRLAPLHRSRSLPDSLNLCQESNKEENTSSIHLREPSVPDYRPLTPPPTPTSKPGFDEYARATPPSRYWGLGGAVRWLQSVVYNQT